MRGHPEFNFPAFFKAEAELRGRFPNARIFSPARRDTDAGFDPTGLQGSSDELAALKFDLREALLADCEFICSEATHIFMLSGWVRSTGATAERALGIALGLQIMGAPA
jgi:hypothetical protein